MMMSSVNYKKHDFQLPKVNKLTLYHFDIFRYFFVIWYLTCLEYKTFLLKVNPENMLRMNGTYKVLKQHWVGC